jgi:hypothetical protein
MERLAPVIAHAVAKARDGKPKAIPKKLLNDPEALAAWNDAFDREKSILDAGGDTVDESDPS